MEKIGGMLILCFLFAMGCAGSGMIKKTDGGSSKSDNAPQSGVAQDASSPVAQLTYIDTLNNGKEIALSPSDFHGRSVELTNNSELVNDSDQGSQPHFSVQVFASNNMETLRAEQKTLQDKVKLPIYIAFESPFYKLLAGDFTKRSDAEASAERFKKMGYADAWVVRGKALSQH